MGLLADIGFRVRPPAEWNGWWVLMWWLNSTIP